MPHDKPRKHHYVSEFQLRLFCESGAEDATLYVYDSRGKRLRASKAVKEASERDYNIIEGDSPNPFAIEEGFSYLEGSIAPTIKNVLEEKVLPETDTNTFIDLITYCAVMYMRVPKTRRFLESTRNSVNEAEFREELLGNEDAWESSLKEHGMPSGRTNPEFSYSKALVEFEKAKERFAPTHNTIMRDGFENVPVVAKELLRRHWSLLVIVKVDYPRFVIGDCPVVLIPNRKQVNEEDKGFGRREVDVFVPLSKSLAMLGSWDIKRKLTHISRERILRLNYESVAASVWNAYGSEADARCMLPSGEEIGIIDYIKSNR